MAAALASFSRMTGHLSSLSRAAPSEKPSRQETFGGSNHQALRRIYRSRDGNRDGANRLGCGTLTFAFTRCQDQRAHNLIGASGMRCILLEAKMNASRLIHGGDAQVSAAEIGSNDEVRIRVLSHRLWI